MREIELKELKKIQINTLKHVAYFCECNSIPFCLCYGTLIGAVRHDGYIPWDDDIDIMMLREDYKKFIRLYSDNDHSEYRLHSIYTDEDFPYPFAKVDNRNTVLQEQTTSQFPLGVNIDVFPIDDIPNNFKDQKAYINKVGWYRHLLTLKFLSVKERENLFKKLFVGVFHLLLSPFSIRRIVLKMDKLAQRFKGESNYVACCVWGYGLKEITSRKAIESTVPHKFEGEVFPIPAGYHEYLSNLYGDYMKLPPENKRVSHHAFVAYWK